MNRVIKFRAWDSDRKKMQTSPKWVEFRVDIKGLLSAVNYNFKGKEIDLPIMQSTGLTDKSGVDIYDGDIVKEIRILHNGPCETNYEVKYKAPSFMVGDLDLKSYAGITREVIGNKFENPELLN